MDRNVSMKIDMGNNTVALRKESVDRNMICPPRGTVSRVALRKESVDRNLIRTLALGGWGRVALRKESVDRNATALLVYLALIRSLSARRAWIEISNNRI